jgi:cell fate (sporulation/competence/biofilm development) regulator YlbF (YheA/YmcA/DUF963 family)
VMYCLTGAPANSLRAADLSYFMQMTAEDTIVMTKTRELCQALVDEPGMKSIRERINAFMQDEKTKAQYEDLVGRGQALQEKQQNSIALSGEEVASFEQDRSALLSNPVARGFLDAQEELQDVRESIQKYITRTLELGRVPSADDMQSCCDHGCGCEH